MKQYNESANGRYTINWWHTQLENLSKNRNYTVGYINTDEFSILFDGDDKLKDKLDDGAVMTIQSQDRWESAYLDLRNASGTTHQKFKNLFKYGEASEYTNPAELANEIRWTIKKLV